MVQRHLLQVGPWLKAEKKAAVNSEVRTPAEDTEDKILCCPDSHIQCKILCQQLFCKPGTTELSARDIAESTAKELGSCLNCHIAYQGLAM